MNTKYRIIASAIAVVVLVVLYISFGSGGSKGDQPTEEAPATFQIK